jgi:hypothetical protein
VNGGLVSWLRIRKSLDASDRRWLRKQVVFAVIGGLMLIALIAFFIAAGTPAPM